MCVFTLPHFDHTSAALFIIMLHTISNPLIYSEEYTFRKDFRGNNMFILLSSLSLGKSKQYVVTTANFKPQIEK